jgi:hypothetical protein
MAPTTRGRGDAEANLTTLINNSPAKKKAAEKRRKDAERKAAEAAEKATRKKASKAKQSSKKTGPKDDPPDYSTFDKGTAILLKQSDAQIAYNVSKMDQYTDTLAGFHPKKHREAARLTKAKVTKYSEYVEALRKGRAELIESAKAAKGKKKTTIAEPLSMISSGEYFTIAFPALGDSPLPLPPAFSSGIAHYALPIFSFHFMLFLLFSFAYIRIIMPGSTPFPPSSALCLQPFHNLALTSPRPPPLLSSGAYHRPYENGIPPFLVPITTPYENGTFPLLSRTMRSPPLSFSSCE